MSEHVPEQTQVSPVEYNGDSDRLGRTPFEYADGGTEEGEDTETGPEAAPPLGQRLGTSRPAVAEPTDTDLQTMLGRRTKLIEVAVAAGCAVVADIVAQGHDALTPGAVKDLLALDQGHLVYSEGVLYRYTGTIGCYEVADVAIEAAILGFALQMEDEVRRVKLAVDGWPFAKANAILAGLPKATGGSAAVNACRASLYKVYQAPAAMNGDQWTLNVQNGLVDLRTQTLRPHTAQHLSSLQLPFAFDSNATCPAWTNYLAQAVPDPATRDVLQEFVGYSLVPTTHLEKALFLHGPGGSGKSTFLKRMRKLVGERNCAAVALDDLGEKFRVVGLRDKLINVVTEVDPVKVLSDARFKAFVSGDPVTGEAKFQSPIVFTPFARFVVAANTLPRVVDHTDAVYRRMIIVKFEQRFVDQPNLAADPPEHQLDPSLEATLDGEMPGILVWALTGLARLLARGRFDLPHSPQENVLAFREEQSNALTFLRDSCTYGPFEVSATDLFRAYESWCKDNCEKPLANNVFGRIVTSYKGVRKGKSGSKGRHYKGLRLAGAISPPGDGIGDGIDRDADPDEPEVA